MKRAEFDAPSPLLRAVIQLIKQDGRSLAKIATDTGIPFYWLRQLAAGKIPNPSVNRIQFLYEALTTVDLPVFFERGLALAHTPIPFREA